MVSHWSDGGLIECDTAEHWCTGSVVTNGKSGMPSASPALFTQPVMSSTLLTNSALVPTMAKSSPHALMIALRVSLALSFESIWSTTTLRQATTTRLAVDELLEARHGVEGPLEQPRADRVVDIGDDGDTDRVRRDPDVRRLGSLISPLGDGRRRAGGDDHGDCETECERANAAHRPPADRATVDLSHRVLPRRP